MKPGELFNKHMTKKKNWIAGAIKKPGALHKELEVPQGKKIPTKKLAMAASKGGKLGQRARLAETLKGLKSKKPKTKKKLSLGGIGRGIAKGAQMIGGIGKAFGKNLVGQDDFTRGMKNKKAKKGKKK